MLKRPTELGVLVMLWSYGLAVLAEAGPSFYQHLEVSDPDRRVTELRERGWTIRGYEPLRLEPPLDWAADPHADSNWQFQLNAMYPLAPVFQALAAEYRQDWHEFAGAVFDDWIAFNLDQDIDHPFRWNDMATGIRAAYLAQLIHHERGHGDPLALARYLDAARWHLQELADPQKLADSNHALFQLVGIAALCAVLEVDECAPYASYAQASYATVFRRQFNEEGMHLEHSPEYHLLALRTFTKIEGSGLLRLGDIDKATLALAAENLSLMMHPDGTFAAIGDTEPGKSSGASAFDPVARWLLGDRTKGTAPDPGQWLFPQTGYAIVRDPEARDGGSYLFLTAAHHSRVHKHMDTGSFEWSDRGRRILIDSGKWGYSRTSEREYVLSSSAHNTIETRGVDNSPGDLPTEAAKLLFLSSAGVVGMTADLRLPRRLVDARFRRTIVTLPGEWLVVVDEIDELLPSTHTAWFQLAPELDLESVADNAFEATDSASSERLLVVPLLPVTRSSAHKGVEEPTMIGWYSPAYGELEPAWQLGFEGSGRRVEMATLFKWLDQDSGAAVESVAALGADRMNLCWRQAGRLAGVMLKQVDGVIEVETCE